MEGRATTPTAAGVPPPAGPAGAVLPAAAGEGHGWHPLGAGLPLPRGPFVALVPGAEAPLLPVDLPAGLRGPAREAVARRALCDRLDRDAASLDLRPARLGGATDEWSALLVTDRAAAGRWRAEVAPAGRRCQAILPDYLALPAAPGVWTVAASAGAVAVRLGPSDGFAAEPALVAAALAEAFARGPAPAAVLRLGPAEPAVDAVLTLQPGLVVAGSAAALPAGVAPPRMLVHGERALDLARDPLAEAGRLAARLRRYAAALVMAAAGLGAWAAAEEIAARRDLAAAAARQAALADLVRRDFVPAGPILDVTLQVTRELERRRRAAAAAPALAPLALLRAAGGVLEASGVVLTSATLRGDGSIALDVEAAAFAELEAFAGALLAAGLAADVERLSAEAGGQVNGTVAVAAGGAGR
ncbi:MAG: hypothetical protein KJZ85_16935 [Rhodobacteraceae bacterium]|nr:hypothetical protein [Paracoccaceae bacterium]